MSASTTTATATEKRHGSMAAAPDNVVELLVDGDVMLQVSGLAGLQKT